MWFISCCIPTAQSKRPAQASKKSSIADKTDLKDLQVKYDNAKEPKIQPEDSDTSNSQHVKNPTKIGGSLRNPNSTNNLDNNPSFANQSRIEDADEKIEEIPVILTKDILLENLSPITNEKGKFYS